VVIERFSLFRLPDDSEIAMLRKNSTPIINTILLVDDNPADNMVHRRILQGMNIAEKILDFLYAQDALDYLKSPDGKDAELIFLDINMPQMNGFEFLDEFKNLKSNPNELPAVVMLSTMNPNWDNDVSKNYPIIRHFFSKPLTEKYINKILNELELA